MYEELMLKTDDNVDIFYRKDIPDNAKGIVVIVHGFAEHLKRYDYVAEVLNKNGYGCYRFDIRGHGKSGGKILDIENYNVYLEDADIIVNKAKQEYDKLPIYMLGHSMGGFITALYGEKYPNKLNGQILSGAATDQPLQVNPFLIKIIKIANKICPQLRIKNDMSDLISRDKTVVQKYKNDPLIHSKATMRFFNQFVVTGMEDLKSNTNKYKYNCLILHGRDDKIISYKSSHNFYNNIASIDKSIIVYDNLYHEIFNEKEKNTVINDMLNWLNEKSVAVSFTN
ncbi:lysophospholipase [Sedimentibacter sp. zth1]|uniref:alpha/beta hydrolase n=1 Tax=Sedimentibacter sp. zth1 TaxID=2816908 RepID=UPI001A91C19D|nr:alpha/beta hydrolase [Sedimentibacter sp. zth1]QSX05572.1 lysophospholipase [Sedimentibacter sp. zth1]